MFKMEEEINTAKCFREVKKRGPPTGCVQSFWAIWTRTFQGGVVGMEVRVQKLRTRGHEEADRARVTSLLHTPGQGSGGTNIQLALKLEGQ